MMEETKTRLQQESTMEGSTDKQKTEVAAAGKANKKKKQMPAKKEQKCKNEFEKHNREEESREKERTVQDIAACKEVIDALFQTREAAEKAVAHMDGVPADGEEVEDLLLKQMKPQSAQDFLYYMSLVGKKEAKKKKKKEAHKSPFNEFTQLNNNNIGSLIQLVDENPQAMKILLFIMQNMDGYNALVCSYAVLEERFGISHATVWRHIKYLKDHGYIYAKKTGSANAYILSPELAWKSWGSNIKYCKFPANVILSYNEQKETESKKKIMKKTGRLELKEDMVDKNIKE